MKAQRAGRSNVTELDCHRVGLVTVRQVSSFLGTMLPATVAKTAVANAVAQDIDGEVLFSMSEAELAEVLGLAVFGHRRKLTLAIDRKLSLTKKNVQAGQSVEFKHSPAYADPTVMQQPVPRGGTRTVGTGDAATARRVGDAGRAPATPARLFQIYARGDRVLRREQYQKFLEDMGESIADLEPSTDEDSSGEDEQDGVLREPRDWWTSQRDFLLKSLPHDLRETAEAEAGETGSGAGIPCIAFETLYTRWKRSLCEDWARMQTALSIL